MHLVRLQVSLNYKGYLHCYSVHIFMQALVVVFLMVKAAPPLMEASTLGVLQQHLNSNKEVEVSKEHRFYNYLISRHIDLLCVN